jgi:hypothetical protein
MTTKSIYLSKLNWIAIVTTAIGFLSMPELKDVVPAKWLPFILVVIGFLNLIVRNFFTSKPTTEFAAERAK